MRRWLSIRNGYKSMETEVDKNVKRNFLSIRRSSTPSTLNYLSPLSRAIKFWLLNRLGNSCFTGSSLPSSQIVRRSLSQLRIFRINSHSAVTQYKHVQHQQCQLRRESLKKMFIQKLQMICCFPMKMCIYGNLIFAFSEAELDRVTCMGNLVSRHCVTYLRVPLDGFSVLCAVGCSYFNCWKPSAAYNPILAFKGNTDYKHERFRVRQTLDANVSLDLLSDITDPTKTAMYISIFSLPIPLLPLPLSKEIMTDLLLSLFLSIFS